MKIMTVVGARPQFIKAAAISRAVASRPEVTECLVHTGQHFDSNMSDVFFAQLDISPPTHNLGISNLSHGAMTGRMLEQLEQLLEKEKPHFMLVYGDTNSTLGAALAASKTEVPLAHVEAGLRSRNMKMPEEVNRVVTDRISDVLFCPSKNALRSLSEEGFPFPTKSGQAQRIHNVGDVMYDVIKFCAGRIAGERSPKQECADAYALATIHRAENTNCKKKLREILACLQLVQTKMAVLLPLHPRTAQQIAVHGLEAQLEGLRVVPPMPYFAFQRAVADAAVVVTDSGGLQKKPSFTERLA